nr:MAG TPA: hypothetical protein [Caudoviricetes sp.]
MIKSKICSKITTFCSNQFILSKNFKVKLY